MVWSYGGGLSPGAGESSGEVVFNTAMTGYQEVLTDPSYKGQIVTMTYPLMGNYGVNPEDIESRGIHVEGFIVKEYHPYPSNWRAQGNLADYLKAAGKLGVEGLDGRRHQGFRRSGRGPSRSHCPSQFCRSSPSPPPQIARSQPLSTLI